MNPSPVQIEVHKISALLGVWEPVQCTLCNRKATTASPILLLVDWAFKFSNLGIGEGPAPPTLADEAVRGVEELGVLAINNEQLFSGLDIALCGKDNDIVLGIIDISDIVHRLAGVIEPRCYEEYAPFIGSEIETGHGLVSVQTVKIHVHQDRRADTCLLVLKMAARSLKPLLQTRGWCACIRSKASFIEGVNLSISSYKRSLLAWKRAFSIKIV